MEEQKILYDKCHEYKQKLRAAGIRADTDLRDNYSVGWKFNHWELKGVPIRMEVGPKDMAKQQCVVVRRDNGEKAVLTEADTVAALTGLLDTIHDSMFAKYANDAFSQKKTQIFF